MNRRVLTKGLGILAISITRWSNRLRAFDSTVFQKAALSEPATALMPPSVAGIRIIDSTIAKRATELSRASSLPYLFNHAVRTFLFGSLVGRARKQSFDDEVLYLGCILHDLGLTDRFQGDLPFEIQGAEAAKRFLEEESFAKDRAGIVWEGIAMHASLVSQFKQPEISLIGEGAGADVIGPDFSEIKKSDVEAVLQAFPRLKFKDAFRQVCQNCGQSLVKLNHKGLPCPPAIRCIDIRFVIIDPEKMMVGTNRLAQFRITLLKFRLFKRERAFEMSSGCLLVIGNKGGTP